MRVAQSSGSILAGTNPTHSNVIDLGAMTPAMEKLARSWGLSIPILRAIGDDQIGFAAEGGVTLTLTEEEAVAEAAVRRGTGMFYLRNYSDAFFQAGGFVTIDPFTGERLVSTHSFVFHALHIAYRFHGLETFYVVVGGITGVIRFLGIPRLNCVVLNQVLGEADEHKQWSIDLYRHLCTNVARYGDELVQIFNTPRLATGVTLGSFPNLGHYIWQELTGIEDILQTHGPDAIRHILLGPYSHLPVVELFPEIADRPVSFYGNPQDALGLSFRLNFQHIRPFGLFIRPSFRARVYRVAEKHVSIDVQKRIAELAASRFLMWVNLRAHNKMWLQQVNGHISVLRRLAAHVPNLTVILDGWTDTRTAGDAIRAGLDPDIEVIDTIGCDLFETFLWSRAAHLYSDVVAAGLFFNSYFASRPGVAHANAWHLTQQEFWAQVSPGSCPPTFLAPSDVSDGGELYSNYDFDPDLLYRYLRELIEKHYPEQMSRI